jgi:hypothetical protein
LQQLFKYAFHQEVNKFTMAIISGQLEVASDVKVETKMSI